MACFDGWNDLPADGERPDCYGDGTVYRGQRSKDSAVKTIVASDIAHPPAQPKVPDGYAKIPKRIPFGEDSDYRDGWNGCIDAMLRSQEQEQTK